MLFESTLQTSADKDETPHPILYFIDLSTPHPALIARI